MEQSGGFRKWEIAYCQLHEIQHPQNSCEKFYGFNLETVKGKMNILEIKKVVKHSEQNKVKVHLGRISE